ncbi:carbohydrate-binding domain-containing protein [Ruminococcus sp.]|uniref:carbohydrate-binding domain-containing protein n=1 Tax=Ruminococcus sp. TaxID=41978 RepID=UPI001B41A105|nr:carbohydrate-binding domain-containing protein [Ruminococcus sp.]MBP5432458.1 carbohydrate-binding domain-containing protein [Ruminococcus sp.]
MKYRRILAAMTAFALMASACSCGKEEKEKTDNVENTTVQDVTSKTGSGEVTEKTTKKKNDENITEKSTEKSGESTTTANAGEKKSDAVATTATNSSTSNTPTAENNNNNNDNNNVEMDSAGDETGGGGDNSAEEKVYTAEIELGVSPKVKGTNVSVSGSIVTINAGGDFRFYGSVSDGQICVSTATEEKVTVVLDGVDISNSNGPAIFINEAKKCTIKSREGTVNYLSDGGNDKINNGVIFSNDTVRLKGNGELNITANNAHGIASDDDIIIDNGTYNINSKKSGLFAHDDITINEGWLNIKGGTNGIKSKGTLNINGGYTVISGGTKEDKSSIYSESSFSYTGGYIYAAGNRVSEPTYSEAPFIILDLGVTAAAGSNVEMLLNGQRMISFEPHNDFRCLLMIAPEVNNGSTFRANVNGEGKDFTVSRTDNIFRMN